MNLDFYGRFIPSNCQRRDKPQRGLMTLDFWGYDYFNRTRCAEIYGMNYDMGWLQTLIESRHLPFVVTWFGDAWNSDWSHWL